MSRLTAWRVMTPMAPDDEPMLVVRLRAGDAGAFDEVYDAYRPRVFAFLLRMTRSRTLAEDLLDETWLRLVRHAPRLLPDTRMAPWLFTVARNLYWTYRRDVLVEETSVPELLRLWPSPSAWPSPFDLAAAGELERRVELRSRRSHRNTGRSSCSSATRVYRPRTRRWCAASALRPCGSGCRVHARRSPRSFTRRQPSPH